MSCGAGLHDWLCRNGTVPGPIPIPNNAKDARRWAELEAIHTDLSYTIPITNDVFQRRADRGCIPKVCVELRSWKETMFQIQARTKGIRMSRSSSTNPSLAHPTSESSISIHLILTQTKTSISIKFSAFKESIAHRGKSLSHHKALIQTPPTTST